MFCVTHYQQSHEILTVLSLTKVTCFKYGCEMTNRSVRPKPPIIITALRSVGQVFCVATRVTSPRLVGWAALPPADRLTKQGADAGSSRTHRVYGPGASSANSGVMAVDAVQTAQSRATENILANF